MSLSAWRPFHCPDGLCQRRIHCHPGANIIMGFSVNYAITAVQPLMAEAYPTEFRNTGVSWCQAFGRVGGALAPIVAGAIMGMKLGLQMSFLFYVIPAVVGALAAFLFVKKETKGKSLDQLGQETAFGGH